MYEKQTYEAILKRMLDRVPNDQDKREGSIIYDAVAPAAAELAQAYIELDTNLLLFSGETSTGEYLDRRTADYGVTRKPATKAKRKGLFYSKGDVPLDVPIGSKFSIAGLNFITVARLAPGQFSMDCEVPGVVGNQNFGVMLPIDYIPNLTRAELADIILAGEDVESDDSLRKRYVQRVSSPSAGGNKADYERWATEVAGVGAAKIKPLWNGAGTIKVVIVDSDRQPAGSALVSSVADHIEGVRPIGPAITVVSAVANPINISATVTLAAGYTIQQVTDSFSADLIAYLKDTAFTITYVSFAKIGTILLAADGVLDYTALTLNGGTANVALTDEEIPAIGTITLGV